MIAKLVTLGALVLLAALIPTGPPPAAGDAVTVRPLTFSMLFAGVTPSGADPRGIAFLDAQSGALRRTPRRTPIADLDSLPMPAWDLIDAAEVGKLRGYTLKDEGSRA